MKKLLTKIRQIDDKYKIIFFRWWFSAAVCFFIAWGLSFGNQDSTFELIFFLGLGMGIANLFIFNPIICSVFDIVRRGKIVNKKMSERSIPEGVFYFLSEIFKSAVSVYIVAWCYEGLNLLINYLANNPESSIPVGLEPILFGVIFTIVYQILGMLWNFVVILFTKLIKKGENNGNLAQPKEEGK